jgi:hypothetical protein
LFGFALTHSNEEAERLLPGSHHLRSDRFRQCQPAFPLLHELNSPDEELRLATNDEYTQKEWADAHHRLLKRLIEADAEGWIAARSAMSEVKNQALWKGLDESQWMELAEKEMNHVYNTVRKKGQFGGVLWRELYLRVFSDSFPTSVDALQTVTERLVQTALSVKTGEALASFEARSFFADPTTSDSKDSLRLLDETFDVELLSPAIGPSSEPAGLLGWMARPNARTLFQAIRVLVEQMPTEVKSLDP